METLTIEIPKGYEVANFDKETGLVSFKEKPKNIKELIKTFSDVLKYHEIDEGDFNELNDSSQKTLKKRLLNQN